MAVTPGHAHLQAIKILHQDKFLAPKQLVPRHPDAHSVRSGLKARILPAICTQPSYAKASEGEDGKNCAVPVLHRDYLVAKDEAPWPVLRQVTPTNFIAGPLWVSRNSNHNKILFLKQKNNNQQIYIQ